MGGSSSGGSGRIGGEGFICKGDDLASYFKEEDKWLVSDREARTRGPKEFRNQVFDANLASFSYSKALRKILWNKIRPKVFDEKKE